VTNTFSLLIEELRAANQVAANVQGLNRSAKKISFSEFFGILVNNAKKYSAMYRTDFSAFSRLPENERIILVLDGARGLLDNFSLITGNLGLFLDTSVSAVMVFQIREIYNNSARALAVAKKMIASPGLPVSEMSSEYGALISETQMNLVELLKHVKRYKIRVEAVLGSMFPGLNLARNSNEVRRRERGRGDGGEERGKREDGRGKREEKRREEVGQRHELSGGEREEGRGERGDREEGN
jgi:hypothetical protein